MAVLGLPSTVEGLNEGQLKDYINKGYKINQTGKYFTASLPSGAINDGGGLLSSGGLSAVMDAINKANAQKAAQEKASRLAIQPVTAPVPQMKAQPAQDPVQNVVGSLLGQTSNTSAPVANPVTSNSITAQTYNPSNVANLLKEYQSAMGTNYAPEYSPENISKLTSQYADLMAPQYERSRGTLANQLAGRGVFSGTPASNSFQFLEAQRMGDIGQYGLGLQNQALQAQTQGRQTALQNAYGLLGQSLMTPYQQQTLSQNQNQFNEEQQRLRDAAQTQKEWEMAQAGGGLLGKYLGGASGNGGSIAGINPGQVFSGNYMDPANFNATPSGSLLGGLGSFLGNVGGNVGSALSNIPGAGAVGSALGGIGSAINSTLPWALPVAGLGLGLEGLGRTLMPNDLAHNWISPSQWSLAPKGSVAGDVQKGVLDPINNWWNNIWK